ncbi:YggS family pyridoxal phosphate-dependent enzyme [Frateuria aurantia]
MSPADLENLESRLRQRWSGLRQALDQACLAAGRAPEDVSILPVSKTFSPGHIAAGQALGWSRFGENRVQEIRDKQLALEPLAPSWVLIGHLQSNKARQAAMLVSELQSLDRLDLARRMDGYLQQAGRSIDVLLQVHTAAEPQKHGISADGLGVLLAGMRSLSCLRLQGLMTVATQTDDSAEVRRCFAALREARDRAQQQLGQSLPRLSMGMSSDYALAIAEGSTEVRIGSALFGHRAQPPT